MNIIDWMKKNYSGKVMELSDRFEFEHENGDHSTIFKMKESIASEDISFLPSIYNDFDGADLFSSTFKIASTKSPKNVEGVELVESIAMLEKYAISLGASFPDAAIPFMYQAGIGVYAFNKKNGYIYEWDEEERRISDTYKSIEEIFVEWLNAVN